LRKTKDKKYKKKNTGGILVGNQLDAQFLT